jgi:hypothetical protein
MTHVRRVLGEGGSISRAATELRIPEKTLYSWYESENGRRRKKAKPKHRLARIRVVPDPTPPSAPNLVVLAPRGLRIEGLDIGDLAALVRALD